METIRVIMHSVVIRAFIVIYSHNATPHIGIMNTVLHAVLVANYNPES